MVATARRRPREEPTWELVQRRNSLERLKTEKFPLDIVDDLPQMIATGYEAVPEEDIVRLNWWGLTHDKPKVGTFMVRIKVPGGQLTPAQLRGVGEISQRYGNNYGELTTRQGLQLHYVRLDQLPEVLDEIRGTGLTTIGGEGDTVRNITGCPVAGIAADELFDVRPVIERAASHFYGHRDYSNLPRKHKFTISACPGQCNAPEIHDVALIAVEKDGRPGFALRVGGGLSNTPRLSRDIGVFVPYDEANEVLAAVTDVWQNEPKYRMSRAKARIKFMVDDLGPEGTREKVEERLGRQLEDMPAPEPEAGYDHLGVHAQAQDGYCYAGLSVPMGWMSGDQMKQVADAVETVGGDIRLTRQQNFIVGGVPTERLGELLTALHGAGFPATRNQAYGNSIACTSHKFCNYSVAETKGKLSEILERLDERFGDQIEGLKIFMDGCPHSCAHHWVGDIGLQGTTAKLSDGSRVEAYDVTLRGGLGTQAQIGKPLLRRIPTEQLDDAVERLVASWLAEKAKLNGHGDGYTFHDFCLDRSDEQLQGIAYGEDESDDGDADAAEEEDTRPMVRVPGTLIELSNGADEIAVEPATVREVLNRLAGDHPDLVGYLLQDGEINPAVNLYIDEEDIRGLGGLDTKLERGSSLGILPALAGG